MRFDKFLLCVFTALVFVCACEKDDDDVEDFLYLNGTLSFVNPIPEYVNYGYEQDVTVTGVRHPDASRKEDGTYSDILGYYFTNSLIARTDTVKRFEDPADTKVVYHFKVDKDSLATFTLSASAYAPGYYSSSCSASVTLVRPGFGEDRTIRGFHTDTPREKVGEKEYYTVAIGGDRWLRQNYADKSKGNPYKDCAVMDDIFGRFYTWTDAQSVCPEGWRLPTSDELDALVNKFGGVNALMADVYFNGSKPANKMWTYWPGVGVITDASRLSFMPTGYALVVNGKYEFHDLNSRAVLWTSDSEDGKGVARYIYEDQNKLFKGSFDKDTFAASVRCVSVPKEK